MTLNLNVFYAEAEEAGSGVDLLLPATSELVAGIAQLIRTNCALE